LIEQAQLINEPDQITWKWTAHGQDTAKSAHLAHFKGSYNAFDAITVWTAHAEGKHTFFYLSVHTTEAPENRHVNQKKLAM
jgi:hypothetical protein